jgi:hypothetical protein
MSDPLRTELNGRPEGDADTERQARIEQLLLSGLDHYFSGQYEEAINVWTRVVFLERGNLRARAYIERARSALAERHRQSEELLHRGMAAYHAGDTGTARELLTRAAEDGEPSDMALVFLERLNRLDVGVTAGEPSQPVEWSQSAGRPAAVPGRPPRLGWVLATVVTLATAGVALLGGLPLGSRLADLTLASPPQVAEPQPAGPLPILRPSDIALARARTLYDSGRLQDALRTLARIEVTDPLSAEANQLRADVQRELLGTSALRVSGPEGSGTIR